ncbi:hypothetical protein FPRO04_14701 [Fusarium proliferatum]|uniref:Cell wall protein phiA n=3 Tax=Fusarium oxysporum TaxID=5507 RepID=A0A420NWW8_FUSOX|nr:hypothetical protein FPRO04_14701 [Fusarium proliferatum]RKK06617.1 hypothetical protein BFJ65_g18515 [Fusarium oxysporum f. sp. cepae]RKK21553.1 hypothetical protein BFJ67_g17213 [Fusarium oxysporum f. sp. cepae]RKK23957.1 hypothetical protein BFJ66_g17287 [Fusarium oxysporum f. sp. cepae]RKK84775.1 hypothetical protein BFJ68_g17336 [Fusarium oxysporum]
MRFLIAFVAIFGYAAGSPHPMETRATNQISTFQIVAFRPDSEIDSLKIKAANNTLYIGPSTQDACCNQRNAEDAATFYLKSEELFLYSPGNPKQQIYVDNSRAGERNIRYYIGSQPQPQGAKTKGWEIRKDGALTFNDGQLMACNNGANTWDVLLRSGDQSAGSCKKCLEFTAKTSIIASPTSCLYSGEHQVVSFHCL